MVQNISLENIAESEKINFNPKPTSLKETGEILLGMSICIASVNISAGVCYGVYRVLEKYIFTNL